MIQAILCFQFKLNQDEAGDIDPEFKPIKLIFNNKEFSEKNFSKLIVRIDIFGVFYQHITGTLKKKGIFSNFYVGRLKKTPYQVISYFRQENTEARLSLACRAILGGASLFSLLSHASAEASFLICKARGRCSPG